ncbi:MULTISPECIES: DNA alkylation repair protein [unclassified Mesorhizobium]|uniref:DNA alkylation repair protein n=1 Tax=unclassified Mesorhizobium TaxID=325217 RepID=UPI000BAE76F2|nr:MULTISPECIES: DNA alkylation repair protein [unclassified Mesorhizobium]TGT59903.1 DNA alkylation repair protein [Mesorhizobium sp. M00.F.Ca.ET.170.01.1.1]AZO08060.1 DNA alkylation repair protein [Mesorhizobium sp. M3A.F.Ca.ET.080.04.2.1]PBB86992.1 DNA alkylation repair protein [Mesorhizobium sp. WSM3876]RWB70337.1 MAG: DNA alkylation repair protein [Mesorhizobium sp.]RWB91402.1 MAG: DNA alkylation repair protein [Mesorhizobium sp.]
MSLPDPNWSADDIVAHLRAIGKAENRAGMARFGITTTTALGVGNSDLRPLARKLKKNHDRALLLWASGIREARLMGAFTGDPKKLTVEQCRRWAADFDSWEVVDSVADLFAETPFWRELIDEFAEDEREFVRRTAFAMLAWAAVHLKKEPDATFLSCLPLIEKHSRDPRNFVRKAVNWALRQIGKRSLALHAPALALAEELAASSDKTARWIGKDAVKEMTDPKQLERLAARKT